MDKEIRTVKRKIIITFSVFVICAVAVIAMIVSYRNRPLDPYVTVTEIQTEIKERNKGILLKIGDMYFEAGASAELAAQFSFEAWQETSQKPTGVPVLLMQFSELWVAELYPGGQLAVYNGYAPMRYRAHAYYTVPSETAEKVSAYIRERGVCREFGDGYISSATFEH